MAIEKPPAVPSSSTSSPGSKTKSVTPVGPAECDDAIVNCARQHKVDGRVQPRETTLMGLNRSPHGMGTGALPAVSSSYHQKQRPQKKKTKHEVEGTLSLTFADEVELWEQPERHISGGIEHDHAPVIRHHALDDTRATEQPSNLGIADNLVADHAPDRNARVAFAPRYNALFGSSKPLCKRSTLYRFGMAFCCVDVEEFNVLLHLKASLHVFG